MNLEVDRDRLGSTRFVPAVSGSLAPGTARLAIDAFALTTNNITYAVLGDRLGYWEAFPAAADDGVRWGRIPAWGVAEVVGSRSDVLPVGLRVFGFLPMGSELVVTPGKAGPDGFSDLAPHRRSLAGTYNRYVTVGRPGEFDRDAEARRMVHQPLFATSLLIEDQLAADPTLDQVLISSASSRTAIGTAYQARARGAARVIGLTSSRNRAFVTELGLYDQVLTYDELEGLPDGRAAFVDIAGSAEVRTEVHERYGDRLATSLLVGVTHRDEQAPAAPAELPGPKPTFFFAPARLAERTADGGAAELRATIETAFAAYTAWTDGWMRYDRSGGPEAVEATYRALLGNDADPRTAAIRSL